MVRRDSKPLHPPALGAGGRLDPPGGRWLWPGRQGVALLASAAVAVAPASAAAQAAAAPAPAAAAEPRDTEQSYGDLGRRFALFLWGKPTLISLAAIDEMVGNPWQLARFTRAKADGLAPRLRLEYYRWAAAHLKTYALLPQSVAGSGGASGSSAQGYPWPTTLDPAAGRALAANLAKTALQHFRVEELVDLGVYSLSRQRFFPTTERSWSRWKEAIVRDDLLLAAAVAAVMASSDSLRGQISGRLATLPGRRFRLGWYSEFAGLGFAFSPTIRSGLKLKSPDVEVKASLNESFGVGPSGEVRVAEVVVNNHWLSAIAAPESWELALTATGRYLIAHRLVLRQGGLELGVDAYFRRSRLGNSRSLATLSRVALTTDFAEHHTVAVAAGVEFRRLDLALLWTASAGTERIAADPGLSTGLLLIWGNTAPAPPQRGPLAAADPLPYRLATMAPGPPVSPVEHDMCAAF